LYYLFRLFSSSLTWSIVVTPVRETDVVAGVALQHVFEITYGHEARIFKIVIRG
jgi:hypothetical protein